MVCEWQKDVSAFHDGELLPDRSSELLQHLDECRECSDFLNRIKSLERLGRPNPQDEVTEKDWDSCWQRIKKETTRRILRRKKVRLLKIVSFVGTAVAVLLICLLLTLSQGTDSSKQPLFVDTSPLEIIDYSSEYTLMLMETEDATVIIMMNDGGD